MEELLEELFEEERRWGRFAEMMAKDDWRVLVRSAGEEPLQVSFARLRSGYSILMDRGAEYDRSAEQRSRPDELFDGLLERCTAGVFSFLPGPWCCAEASVNAGYVF